MKKFEIVFRQEAFKKNHKKLFNYIYTKSNFNLMMPFDAQKAASNNAKNRISKFEIVFEKFEKNCYCSVAQITFE